MNNNTNPAPITQEEAHQLAESYARFHFLRNATIKQAKDDDEIAGLTEYLARFFLDHASEFIGCFFVCNNEYQPIVNAVLPLVRRCIATLQHQQQLAAQQQQPAESQPANVTNLVVPPSQK